MLRRFAWEAAAAGRISAKAQIMTAQAHEESPGLRRRQHVVVTLLFATYFLTYLDRAAMATALPFIAREFNLTSVSAGAVLSAFFLGYAVMQIPSGIMVDRWGPVRLLLPAVICWSLFTAMTGLVQSLAALIVVRILFGISEGPAPAAVSKTLSIHVPHHRIGRSNGLVLAGTLVGATAAPTVTTAIVLEWGWRMAFFILLAPGLMLALATYRVLGRSTPAVPIIDQRTGTPGGWQAIFQSRQLRWCFVSNFLAGAANWGLQNWLPSYLLEARGYGVARMGIMATLPFAAGALGYLAGGVIGDRVFAGRRHHLIVLCLLGSALATYCAAVVSSGELSIALMTGSFFMLGMGLSTLFTMPLLLAPPELAGTAYGTANTAAQIAGFVSPLLIGLVLDSSGQNFTVALYFIVVLLVTGAAAASRIGDVRKHANVAWRQQSRYGGRAGADVAIGQTGHDQTDRRLG
jgi:MFS family permease